MDATDRVNILIVDDQPAKLLSYEAVLSELGENLIRAGSAREALEQLLKTEVAVILVDVCMPELDGFQLARMIRDHPRFKQTAILFISAVQLDDLDRLRGYQLGAVDYVPVPIIPELLRAKVKVFIELHRKKRQLEDLNRELESRVAERTAELEAVNSRLKLAIDVAQLGTWDWNLESQEITWSERYSRMFGYHSGETKPSVEAWCDRLHPEDVATAHGKLLEVLESGAPYHHVYRCVLPDGAIKWYEAKAQREADAARVPRRMVGVVMDITEHKLAEERQRLMLQELHHRVKNSLATVQAIASLTARTCTDIAAFQASFSERLQSLGRTHTMLVSNNWQWINIDELLLGELSSFAVKEGQQFTRTGPPVNLPSEIALSLGLAFHELATNAAKYGALSVPEGHVDVCWNSSAQDTGEHVLQLHWVERGGPRVAHPVRNGFGSILLKRLFAGLSGAKAEVMYVPEGLQFHASVLFHPRPEQRGAVIRPALLGRGAPQPADLNQSTVRNQVQQLSRPRR